MATHSRAFAGGLAEHFFDCEQAVFGDQGLPGVIANTIGKGIEYSAGFL
jgi:hypothetical protein